MIHCMYIKMDVLCANSVNSVGHVQWLNGVWVNPTMANGMYNKMDALCINVHDCR